MSGEAVCLRPLSERDLPRRAQWTSDAGLIAFMGADLNEEPPGSPDEQLASGLEWMRDRQRDGDALYAIEAAGEYIGDIDVHFVPRDRKAELTVFIGDRSQWGKGYGTESVRLVLDELASEPGVGRVEVDVPPGNDRGFAFWTRLGFEHVATDENGLRWLRRAC